MHERKTMAEAGLGALGGVGVIEGEGWWAPIATHSKGRVEQRH